MSDSSRLGLAIVGLVATSNERREKKERGRAFSLQKERERALTLTRGKKKKTVFLLGFPPVVLEALAEEEGDCDPTSVVSLFAPTSGVLHLARFSHRCETTSVARTHTRRTKLTTFGVGCHQREEEKALFVRSLGKEKEETSDDDDNKTVISSSLFVSASREFHLK